MSFHLYLVSDEFRLGFAYGMLLLGVGLLDVEKSGLAYK